MATSSGANLAALLEQFERCQARNRDLEAQLQAQRQETAEAKEEARQLALQLARREAGDEAGERAMESIRQELGSLRRRMRYDEFEEGQELLLFVARRLMETWDAKTQRGVLLATKATYAELLPRVTRAVLRMARPCSFAGAIGLQELTLERIPPDVESEFANWSHLTGLRVLTLRSERADRELMIPASIRNLAGLSELHAHGVGLTGLRYLSALSRLASLHVVDCELEYKALPVLPSLRVLHVQGYAIPAMHHLARQPNLTKLTLYCHSSSMPRGRNQLTVLTGLRELVLRECLTHTASLDPLTPLTALTHLNLQQAGMTSMQPLTTLKQLRVLGLSRALWGQDLGPLTHLCALEHLDVSEFRGHGRLDVGPLTALTSLKTINMTDSHIENEELLDGMQELTVLRGCNQEQAESSSSDLKHYYGYNRNDSSFSDSG